MSLEAGLSTAAAQVQVEEAHPPGDSMVLRLRLPTEDEQVRVRWDPNTINNEHLNKKKSNKCCIYHKPKQFDESDSESSGSDNEEEFRRRYPKYAGRKPPSKPKNKHCKHHHHHKDESEIQKSENEIQTNGNESQMDVIDPPSHSHHQHSGDDHVHVPS